MSLFKNDNLECPECSNELFIQEERFLFHKNVRARNYPTEKEKPLIPIQKEIIYKCSKCGFVMDI